MCLTSLELFLCSVLSICISLLQVLGPLSPNWVTLITKWWQDEGEALIGISVKAFFWAYGQWFALMADDCNCGHPLKEQSMKSLIKVLLDMSAKSWAEIEVPMAWLLRDALFSSLAVPALSFFVCVLQPVLHFTTLLSCLNVFKK